MKWALTPVPVVTSSYELPSPSPPPTCHSCKYSQKIKEFHLTFHCWFDLWKMHVAHASLCLQLALHFGSIENSRNIRIYIPSTHTKPNINFNWTPGRAVVYSQTCKTVLADSLTQLCCPSSTLWVINCEMNISYTRCRNHVLFKYFSLCASKPPLSPDWSSLFPHH